MTYYRRELYQKQHHRRSWRKPTQRKNGGGILVYATSGEAKREGVSRPHASLRGIQRRLSVWKVPIAPAVHIWAGRRCVTGHSVLFAEKKVSNTRLASASGSAFLRNWKLSLVSKRSGRTDRCWSVNSVPYHHYGDWCTEYACAGLDQDANAGGSKSPKAKVLRHERDSKCHWMHWWHTHPHSRPKPTGTLIRQPEELSFDKCSG